MIRGVGILVAMLLLAGCAGRETSAVIAGSEGLPPVAEVASVPFFPQEDKACGPASLAMVLNWSGQSIGPDSLSAQVYTPGREGSLAMDMVAAARRQGRMAVPVHGLRNLLAELAAGHPVVVFQNLGLDIKPVWHFAVAIGYDLSARKIRLHSGLDEGMVMSLDTFEHTWERTARWAMVVMPPDRLSVTAAEGDAVEAAAGLERVGLGPAAAQAFETILARWPHSLPAVMGLGNARYGQGDLPAAERAFADAARRHPDSAPAWNNWAHVLLKLGRVKDAVHASRRAVALGGQTGPYAATWSEVQAASHGN